MIELSESRIYEFEEFRLDANSHRLFRRESGELVPLQPKAVELLLFLVQNAGRILSKDELFEAVWENAFIEDANLSQTIFVLRKTLSEDTKNPRFILTVPNRGYQFIAPVKEINSEDRILEESFLASDHSSQFPNSKPNPQSKLKTPHVMWFALVPVLLIAFGIYWFYPAAKPVVTVSEIKTLAVLPFEDLSVEQTEKYLGVSLADALANKFSGLKQLTVRPTRSVSKYADRSEDIPTIGLELQVDAVLDGRIQRIGERIRVSVQLIRTADNATIWTGNFDDQFTNFFAVQDSISQKVVQTLALQIDEKERERLTRHGTENAAAYQDYLVGRYFWNKRTGTDLLRAIENFEKATQKDQNFAQAYAGLANCYILLPEYGVATPHEAFPKAKTAVLKALELDELLAEAHTALAYAQAFYDWNWSGAEQSFKRALELNPNYATAYQWYGEYLLAMGHFDESRKNLERAIEIDPVSPIVLTTLASLYEHQEDYEKEIELAKKVLEIEPNFAYGYFYLGLGYERKGMDAEAAEALAKTMILFGEPPEFAEEVTAAFKKNGLKGWWRKRLEQIETRPQLKYFQAYSKAMVQIRLDDKEGTLESLNQSFQQRDRWLVNIKYQSHFKLLRQDPRFQDILRRMNF